MAKSNKAQKKKHQKKVARRKKLERAKNTRGSMRRYRLDVKFEGGWRTYKHFKTLNQVKKHVDDTEKIRQKGDTEIIEGRVIDLNDESILVKIPPYVPLDGMTMFDIAKQDLSSNKAEL
jgi:hypothetical protein